MSDEDVPASGQTAQVRSDFPNIPYYYLDAMRALTRLDVDDDWLRAVFYENAATLFGWPPP